VSQTNYIVTSASLITNRGDTLFLALATPRYSSRLAAPLSSESRYTQFRSRTPFQEEVSHPTIFRALSPPFIAGSPTGPVSKYSLTNRRIDARDLIYGNVTASLTGDCYSAINPGGVSNPSDTSGEDTWLMGGESELNMELGKF